MKQIFFIFLAGVLPLLAQEYPQGEHACKYQLARAAGAALGSVEEMHSVASFNGLRALKNELEGVVSPEALRQLRQMEANMNRNFRGFEELSSIFSAEWPVIEKAAQARAAGILGELPVSETAYSPRFSTPLTKFRFYNFTELDPELQDDPRALHYWTISHTLFGATQMVEEVIRERVAQILDNVRYPEGKVSRLEGKQLASVVFGGEPQRHSESVLVYRQPLQTQDAAADFLALPDFKHLPAVVIANESKDFHLGSAKLKERATLVRASFMPRGIMGSVYLNCESVHILGGGLPFLLDKDIERILESALAEHEHVSLHFYLGASYGLMPPPQGADLEVLELADDDDEVWTPEREAAFDLLYSNFGESEQETLTSEWPVASVFPKEGELISDAARWMAFDYQKRGLLLQDRTLDLLEFPFWSNLKRGEQRRFHYNNSFVELEFEVFLGGLRRRVTIEYNFLQP